VVAQTAVVATGTQATVFESCVLNHTGKDHCAKFPPKFLVPMYDAEPALDLRLGRETFATFVGDLEKTGCLDRTIDLPYGLRG